MAPVAPTKSPSASTLRKQRITGQIHPLLPSKIFRPDAAVSDSFLSSKRDKRRIKHSVFLSRVQASSSSGVSKSKHRRNRRPANKLASLSALADALPEDDDDDAPRDGKVRHKSLRSRKGALKRKERVVRGEMERFGASMARLSEVPATSSEATVATKDNVGIAQAQRPSKSTSQDTMTENTPPATSNRWAALRGYISATMEQNPAFAGSS